MSSINVELCTEIYNLGNSYTRFSYEVHLKIVFKSTL